MLSVPYKSDTVQPSKLAFRDYNVQHAYWEKDGKKKKKEKAVITSYARFYVEVMYARYASRRGMCRHFRFVTATRSHQAL